MIKKFKNKDEGNVVKFSKIGHGDIFKHNLSNNIYMKFVSKKSIDNVINLKTGKTYQFLSSECIVPLEGHLEYWTCN